MTLIPDEDPSDHRYPPRPDLDPAFALRLADQKGVSQRELYPPEEAYAEPWAAANAVVFDVELPLKVRLLGLSRGFLLFDFSENQFFCGGALPSPPSGPAEEGAYAKAENRRQLRAERRLKFINAFLPTLWGGGQRAQSGLGPQTTLNRGNYLCANNEEGSWRVTGPNAGGAFADGVRVSIYVPWRAFANAAEDFTKIHSVLGEDTFELLPLLQDCASAYSEHHFAASAVIGWAAAEAILNRRWKAYISDALERGEGADPGASARRDRLQGHDFNASVVTEVLALAGKLRDRDRQRLDDARKLRNGFVHQLKPVDSMRAMLGATTAASLIGEEAGFDFRISSGFRYQV